MKMKFTERSLQGDDREKKAKYCGTRIVKEILKSGFVELKFISDLSDDLCELILAKARDVAEEKGIALSATAPQFDTEEIDDERENMIFSCVMGKA